MTKASKPRGPLFVPNPKARLFDQAREVMRFHLYALRTEEAYLQWIYTHVMQRPGLGVRSPLDR